MTKFAPPPARHTLKSPDGPAPKIHNPLNAPETAPNTRRKTGRTVSFGTRVSPEFDEDFRTLAFREKMKHTELLEAMLDLYKRRNS